MWGTTIRMPAIRGLATAGLLLVLSACATHHPAPSAAAGPPPPRPEGERDATGAYRFNMTQNGRRMTADEFDAWMKARGIRVAKGAPAAAPPGRATAQAKSSKARPVVASATKPRPASAAKPAVVAQAAKPKPKPKPVAKEVSEARAPAKQGGTGEG